MLSHDALKWVSSFVSNDALGDVEFMDVLDYFIVYACIYISGLCIHSYNFALYVLL